jgi:DNA-directed RNA polymerase subunit RPC12/RpoP
MNYECPRCSKPVTKQSKSSILFGGGLVGALLASAFSSYECGACGKIPRKEFPPEIRSKMMKGTLLLIVGAVVLFVVVVGVLIALANA